MASLRDIRTRINSVQNIKQVTRAMKMVAAAKLRRAQERIFATRPYAFKLRELIHHLQRHLGEETQHPLFEFEERPAARAALAVVVTGDRGLAGAFNSNILKLAERTIDDRYGELHRQGRLHVLPVGRKAYDHFAKRGYPLVGDFRGVFDDLDFRTAQRVVEAALDGYRDEHPKGTSTQGTSFGRFGARWDEARLIYNEFKNTIAQNRIAEPLLPIPRERFLTPVMEEETDDTPDAEPRENIDYLFEPDGAAILKVLVPQYLAYQVWRALLESNAAEQGARMVAMDNATTNAEDLLEDLSLKYNRARQDAITTEIIEITSGAEALAQG